jgi:hypothetical protein
MDKDEIDLSAYPSYLGVRSAANEQDHAATEESVARGLAYAGLVSLAGVALGVVVSRQTLVAVNIDTIVGAVTSGAMILAYSRGAGAPPRRGLVLLLLLFLAMLFVGIAAILMARGWWVYTLLDEAVGMPMSRSSFIWSMTTDRSFYRNLFFPFALSSVSGCCLALWKVRRRTTS